MSGLGRSRGSYPAPSIPSRHAASTGRAPVFGRFGSRALLLINYPGVAARVGVLRYLSRHRSLGYECAAILMTSR